MLEGLEVSVLNFKEVLLENDTQRIDSEYFKKDFLKKIKKLKSNNFKYLFEIGSIKGGKRLPKGEEFSENGIPYIRAQDIKNNFIEYESSPKISEALNAKLINYQTLKNDVLITNVGNSIGDTGIVKFELEKCNLTENAVKIISKGINPDYLFSFLQSKFGKFQIERETVGTAQPKLAIERIKKIIIPLTNEKIQLKINEIIENSFLLKTHSKEIYTQAENLLLQELGLQDFTPSQEPVNIKSFKDSFATSGRLDAEYYQPKYEDYLNLIYNYKHGFDSIGKYCKLKSKNYKPLANKKYKYVELSNVDKSGTINSCTLGLGKELPSRARRKINTGDVIVSSIEGSLESCGLVTDIYNNGVCSTGFYVLRSDKINSETLLVLFKSELMQNILKQHCSGTILTSLNKDDFNKIPIPNIDEQQQQQIADLIEQSFALKKQSEHLLEVAKKAVEIAIEKDEATALEYIQQTTVLQGQ